VREAIRRLASLGLVEVHPHRGAFVRGLTEDDLQDTLETRLILEIAAIQRAAEIFSEAHYSEAEALLERHQALLQAGLVVEAREAHTQFHFTLYRASRLRWLVSAIEPVFRNSERYRFLAAGTRPEAEARAEHHAILDACAARKPQEAAEALSVHLKGASERMLVNLQASGLASQDTDIDEDTEL
jgi:DNA-binding GntR family transcriptional regulator